MIFTTMLATGDGDDHDHHDEDDDCYSYFCHFLFVYFHLEMFTTNHYCYFQYCV